MKTIHIYLNFNGNTEEAFGFYKEVFNSEYKVFQRFGDDPERKSLPANALQKVKHVALPLDNDFVLMGTDIVDKDSSQLQYGNNSYICINVDTEAEASTLFNKLSLDGYVQENMHDTPWGGLYGSLTDKFGIQWIINYEHKNYQWV